MFRTTSFDLKPLLYYPHPYYCHNYLITLADDHLANHLVNLVHHHPANHLVNAVHSHLGNQVRVYLTCPLCTFCHN